MNHFTPTLPDKKGNTRLLLVDVHAYSRKSSKMLLDVIQGLQVVGETSDYKESLQLATTLRPDIVIISMRVQGSTGPDTARDILKLLPNAKVVFWTLFDDPEYVKSAMAAGAHAYVLKQEPAIEIQTAIAAVLAGKVYLSPGVSFK